MTLLDKVYVCEAVEGPGVFLKEDKGSGSITIRDHGVLAIHPSIKYHIVVKVNPLSGNHELDIEEVT